MPTATGVFEPKRAQPFMSPYIEEKLVVNYKVYRSVELLVHLKCFYSRVYELGTLRLSNHTNTEQRFKFFGSYLTG